MKGNADAGSADMPNSAVSQSNSFVSPPGRTDAALPFEVGEQVTDAPQIRGSLACAVWVSDDERYNYGKHDQDDQELDI
jgi:hypothetical protein